MDEDHKRRIGIAIQQRITDQGYATREQVAGVARIGVRTLYSLVTGEGSPTPRTLGRLDAALGYTSGTLAAVFRGEKAVSVLTRQRPVGPADFGQLQEALEAAGVTTDPAALAEAASKLGESLPDAAGALETLAGLLAGDDYADVTDGLGALNREDRARLSAAAHHPAGRRAGQRLSA